MEDAATKTESLLKVNGDAVEAAASARPHLLAGPIDEFTAGLMVGRFIRPRTLYSNHTHNETTGGNYGQKKRGRDERQGKKEKKKDFSV